MKVDHDTSAPVVGSSPVWRLRALVLAGLVLGAGAGVFAATGGTAIATTSGFTVRVAFVRGVGRVLVDSAGRTLYVFSKDRADHNRPTCTSTACTSFWPPLVVRKSPTGGAGVDSRLLGRVRDPNGKWQVTYDHQPLYRFAGDKKPGQAKGEGVNAFGGIWRAVNAKGRPVVTTTTVASSTTTTTYPPY